MSFLFPLLHPVGVRTMLTVPGVLVLPSFMKNVYTVFSVDDNGVGFAPLA